MSCDMEFQTPLGLPAVHADDLLCAAKIDVIKGLQTRLMFNGKRDRSKILIEYDSMYPDQSVILLHQEHYTYELVEKFPYVKPRAFA
eukprot:5588522-Amphidinium_carterae.1